MPGSKVYSKFRLKSAAKVIGMVMTLSLFYNNCSGGGGSSSLSESSLAAAPYCPYLPSKVFANAVSLSGRAVYEYRVNGNGVIANGAVTLTPQSTSGVQTFSLTVNSQIYSWSSPASFAAADVANALASAIQADPNAAFSASSSAGTLLLTLNDETLASTLSLSANLKMTQGALPNPIRFAEVTVRDSSGTIVQCAETTDQGQFSFTLPQSAATYTISVSSRANNSSLQAYVLQDPSTNSTYSVNVQASASTSTSNLRIVASAQGSLEGGAFNILDQIARANIFLRNFTSASQGCGTTFADCVPFQVGPMVTAYWKKGFNPGTYQGMSPTSGISYYLPGKSQLYIMGGVNGDVDYSDTDHFDNSVIIHEYGHFMEDHYGKSDSPGGSHDGYSQLDPRLAWSEGWADFFQAVVTGNPVYRDTYGNVSGSTGIFFNEDIENLTASSADRPASTPVGEGNYHEFSITRLLWDAIDPHPVTGAGANPPDENVQGPFAEIWSVFSGTSSGFHSQDQHFRNIGLFHLIQNFKSGRTDWATLRSMEYQNPDRRTYGAVLSTDSCSSASSIAMTSVLSYDTNYFNNNRFLSYYHPGGTLDLLLNYSTPTGSLADLDLFVYQEDYVYGDKTTIVGSSQSTPPVNCSSSNQCREHVVVNLPAGFYLVNVSATSSNSGLTNFNFQINSQPACVTN